MCGTNTGTGILRKEKKIDEGRTDLLYKYINLYPLKAVFFKFTFHRFFYILSTIFSLYPEIWKIQKSGPLQSKACWIFGRLPVPG